MQKLCDLDDIDPAMGLECSLQAGDVLRHVLVVMVDGDVRAWANVCPHMGRSLSWAPGEFLYDNQGRLVCPHHGALFITGTGECVEGPCRGASLTPVAIDVRGGEVFAAQPAA
ncbi:Rieske 2Fe-2S domain-containing protein [Marinihelvus fidelis]|uniref:Rieske 2Fe-2S domain-containing protein n=1 Tax=Marinihelvus fidelis TaxID=2613842 RepID=A0A5N0T901_9GAMM|nr:Rieske 2Fe-2S domain-containing protein [Marinihelvus fidelis]KAA9130954.1 Rieske 2Fe-2S domain-containing protein [Marinihelvus fidelis]